MSTDQRPLIVVVGHGTVSQDGIDQFLAVVSQLQTKVSVPVSHGFIESAYPDARSAISQSVALYQPTDVVVLPLLLLPAGHVKNDVPAAVAAARTDFPTVRFTYARDLSVAEPLLSIIEERSHNPFDHLSTPFNMTGAPDFTLLVGRGSSDRDANSDLYKIARLLTERQTLGKVEPAFISLALPSVPEALDNLKRLGATGIAIAPYFLFTGVLLDRIYSQARKWHAGNPEIPLWLAREIGADPRLVDLLAVRYSEAGLPLQFRNCDTCVYRSEALGYRQ